MSSGFDIAAYREAKRASGLRPMTATIGQVIDALSDRKNLDLWKEGVVRFDPVSGSQAYSHFAGFRRAMVDAAAEAASQHGVEGEARFAANDLEEALDPARVSLYLESILPDATEGDLRRSAAAYLEGAMGAAARVRQRHRPRPA